jgi:hypothetical protein
MEADPDDPEDVDGWYDEGGLNGSSSGTAYDWCESLAELNEQVDQDVEQYRERYPGLRIVRRLDDVEQAITKAAKREGVELVR